MSPQAPWGEPVSERLEDRLSIDPDGTIVARSGKVEYGQGIRTAFAMIVAEEMGVPVERVRVVLGETDSVPWDMGTFGSLSVATDGQRLRDAAAFARTLLDAGTPLTGEVPYGFARRRTPAPATDRPCRVGAADVVIGRARYVADVRLPGMLRGCVLHPPSPGARLTQCASGEADALPGVRVVREGDFVGVVAERDEQAREALRSLRATWTAAPPEAQAVTTLRMRHDDGVDDARVAAPHRVDAAYSVPHISHALIGPLAAVADVRDGSAHVHVETHRPFAVRDDVARALHCDPESVHVHPEAATGMYGRGNASDVAVDAARLSRAAGCPVLVQWTREEEFRYAPNRPVLEAHLSAGLDGSGRIVAWTSDVETNSHAYAAGPGAERMIEMTSGRNAVPAYQLGRVRVTLNVVPSRLRTGPFRSLAAAPNIFAIESFLDELALVARLDPIAFRLRMIDDPRLRRVLERVREESGWRDRAHERGHGLGVACVVYNETYVAAVAHVVVHGDGRAHLQRAWCAVDAGHIVHPDGARNQIEGGVQQAASWTLIEELPYRNGSVTAATWHDYPIATMLDAPQEIRVVFTGDDATESTGVGEAGSVPMAAAMANAVFDACGVRVRRLPITPQAIAAARR